MDYANSINVYGYEIMLLRRRNFGPPTRNLYVRLFFAYCHERGHLFRENLPEGDCRYCGRQNACKRQTDKRIQFAMMQLYVDVSTKSNSRLTNENRRYIFASFYTALTRGRLNYGERYPVDDCVRREFSELFPSNIFTGYSTL